MWGCGAALSTSRAVLVRIVLALGTPHSQLHGLQLQLSCNQSSTIECITLLRSPIFYNYNIVLYAWLHTAAICVFSSESVTFLASFHSLCKCILSGRLYFSVHILSRFQVWVFVWSMLAQCASVCVPCRLASRHQRDTGHVSCHQLHQGVEPTRPPPKGALWVHWTSELLLCASRVRSWHKGQWVGRGGYACSSAPPAKDWVEKGLIMGLPTSTHSVLWTLLV